MAEVTHLEFDGEDEGDDESPLNTPVTALSGTALKELNRMYDRDGKLTAESTVDEAQNPKNPLHKAFEWDDTIAGYKYRLQQARWLIGRVKIVVDGVPVRGFIKIESTNSYEPTPKVMAVADLQAEAIRDFLRDAERFKRKWENNRLVASHYQSWLAGQGPEPTVRTA